MWGRATVGVFVLLLVAGCGSSARSKSERAFIARANAVCKGFATSRAQSGLATRASANTPAVRAQRFGERYRLRKHQLDEFRALSPPAKDRARYASFVAAYAKRVELTRASQDAARRNDPAKLRSDGRQDRVLFLRSTRLAQKLGFTACGRSAKR
ncbi:MAG: hypothetical protein QOK04_640 [Solirubrobacteraceae bacterium]|nr:hypothetical protein [Solirubrobacteraceae bacterium]